VPLPLAAAPHHSLEDWRGRIDAIDAALVHLLNLRIEYARGAGRAKRAQGAPLQAPAREGEVLARVQALNPGPLDPQALAAIYRAILHASLQAQERERVLEGR
ncbi:MAG: chorismate mutase, partial [Terriglobales bacterium]